MLCVALGTIFLDTPFNRLSSQLTQQILLRIYRILVISYLKAEPTVNKVDIDMNDKTIDKNKSNRYLKTFIP